jgi:hypothetical protein
VPRHGRLGRAAAGGGGAGGLGFEAFDRGVLDAEDGVAGQSPSGWGVKPERSGMGRLEESPGFIRALAAGIGHG